MYNYEDYFSDEEYFKRYKLIKEELTCGIEPSNNKCTFILGGQPGSGKTVFYQGKKTLDNYIPINGDDFRRFHPCHKEIIKTDIENYANRTQAFSNKVVEQLIEDLGNDGYNLIIEGTLRNPNVAINTNNVLKNKGYKTELIVIACDAETAWKATLERANFQKEHDLVPRYTPIDKYNVIVNNIVNSLNIIEINGCFDSIVVMNRDGAVLFDKNSSVKASEVLKKELNLDNWNSKYKSYEEDFINKKIELLNEKLKQIQR